MFDRANHTGVQPMRSVAGLQAALDAKISRVVAGTNITLSGSGTETDPIVVNASGSGSGSGTLELGGLNASMLSTSQTVIGGLNSSDI